MSSDEQEAPPEKCKRGDLAWDTCMSSFEGVCLRELKRAQENEIRKGKRLCSRRPPASLPYRLVPSALKRPHRATHHYICWNFLESRRLRVKLWSLNKLQEQVRQAPSQTGKALLAPAAVDQVSLR